MSRNTKELFSPADIKIWEVTTSLDAERCALFKWRIKNFLCWPADGFKKIRSPSFSCSSTKWAIDIYPNGESFESLGKISIYLAKLYPGAEQNIEYKVFFEDIYGANQYQHEGTQVSHPRKRRWGWSPFVEREIVEEKSAELLPDGVLTVCCAIKFKQGIIHGEVLDISQRDARTEYDATVTFKPKAVDILLRDLEALMIDHRNCDVTFQVGVEKISAHKGLLAARSTVFAGMFEHMKESRSNIITIVDIQPEIVRNLLRYIYTGKVDEMSVEKALGLYVAADKYALLELKSQCSSFLMRNLSVENACEVAIWADAQNDRNMINSVKTFARMNLSLLYTDKWDRLAEQNPFLAREIAKSFRLDKSPKS